jgi:hypothetical protein
MDHHNWKTIFGHKWNKEINGVSLYDLGVKYLHGDKDFLKHFSIDSKRDFINRMTHYTLNFDKTRLQYESKVPPWKNFTFNTDNFIFHVVKPSEIQEIIEKFFSESLYTATNSKTLYDKIIRAKYIGISRNDIADYLKKKPAERSKLVNVGGTAYVKSYRPNYPFQHWQIDHIDLRSLAKKNNNVVLQI